jgi:hypothetical protein
LPVSCVLQLQALHSCACRIAGHPNDWRIIAKPRVIVLLQYLIVVIVIAILQPLALDKEALLKHCSMPTCVDKRVLQLYRLCHLAHDNSASAGHGSLKHSCRQQPMQSPAGSAAP